MLKFDDMKFTDTNLKKNKHSILYIQFLVYNSIRYSITLTESSNCKRRPIFIIAFISKYYDVNVTNI